LVFDGVHSEEIFVEFRKNIPFNGRSAVCQDVLAKVLAEVVLGIDCLDSFVNNTDDALHGLGQEGSRLLQRTVL
jgi:hypothetical protein